MPTTIAPAGAAAGTGARTARRDLVHFLLRRLHSLTGVVPIGAFLIEHFYSNYQAVGSGGQARFDRVVADLQTNPVVVWLEIFGIGLPLLYHAGYGLFIAREARYNTGAYRYGANLRFLLQRLSGVFLILYIGYHVWMTRLQPVVHADQFAGSHGLVTWRYMHDYLNEALFGVLPTWIFYVLGVTAACYHFANGLWGFLIHWGITVGPRAQRVAAWLCTGLGLLLLVLGLNSLLAFVMVGP
jgi:succinate dehydrogenase cytochrome b subunit